MPAPSFNTWTSLFLLAAVQGLFICAVFTWKLRRTHTPFRWLIALVALFSLTLIAYVLFWTRYQQYFPHLLGIVDTFPFLFGPFFYFYFRQIFTRRTFQQQDWLHLLPFLLFFAMRLPVYFLVPMLQQGATSSYLQFFRNIMPFITWLKMIHLISYAIFIHKAFFSLSRTSPEVKRWYRWLNIFLVGFILSYTSYYLLARMPFFNPQWDYMISFSMTIFIYGLALVGYMQPQVFGLVYMPVRASNVKYKNSGLTETAAQQLQERLSHLMLQDKLYRDSELRLEKLADMLGTTKHNLSQVINERLGQSFFDYLNALRIEEAKQLLATTTKEEMTIIQIAYQVGFNNKVSFNSTFKKGTNLTPTQYRERHFCPTGKENLNEQHATMHR